MEIWLIIALICVNAVFALSEMAVVSSSKVRLQQLADEKRPGARTALKLHQEPSRFLSTVQVGITLVAILNGFLGEDALVTPLKQQFLKIPFLEPYAEAAARVATVSLITYFSVVIGELAPKRLALLRPERAALIVARPMNFIAVFSSPFVWLLSVSSNGILRLLRAHRQPEATVTNEEIKLLMEIGSKSGVFHESEGALVTNVMRLDEQRVGAIMTPRKDIYCIDLDAGEEEILARVADCPYSRAVVCRKGLDNITGVLQRSDLLQALMQGMKPEIRARQRPAVYVPDNLTLAQLLKFFQENHADFVLVVNEYGETEGLATLSDVLGAIVGELPSQESMSDPEVLPRAEGGWVIDGGVSIKRLKMVIGMNGYFPGEADNEYNTLSGLILYQLEKIPQVGDHFDYLNWYFEVAELDEARINKVLVTCQLAEAAHA